MEEKSTIITIDIPSDDHMTFKLNYTQSKGHGSWLDWGDGSDRLASENEGLIEAEHTYEEPGEYEIMLFGVDEATIGLVSIDSDIGYRSMITSVRIGEDVDMIADEMFASCENLELVEFLTSENHSIELGEYVFANCSSLTDVVLPTDLSRINLGMFFNCTSLKSINLPESLSIVDDNAFYGCSQLRNVALSNVYSVGKYAFHGCRKLSGITLTETAHEIGEGAFDSCNGIRNADAGDVDSIGDNAFCNCRSLTKVNIGSSVRTIGEKSFYNCKFLKEIKIAATTPPVLRGSMAFPEETDFVILIPTGMRREYARETNWNLYIDKMQEADYV